MAPSFVFSESRILDILRFFHQQRDSVQLSFSLGEEVQGVVYIYHGDICHALFLMPNGDMRSGTRALQYLLTLEYAHVHVEELLTRPSSTLHGAEFFLEIAEEEWLDPEPMPPNHYGLITLMVDPMQTEMARYFLSRS